MATDEQQTVRAAGGVVWRRSPGGDREVALVRRDAYDDWTFPKGKLKRGESEAEAAVREVEEETGLRCLLGPELGTTRYRDPKDRPKTVRYWEMTGCEGELSAHNEIDAARWVPIEEARRLLTYPRDRALLERLSEGP